MEKDKSLEDRIQRRLREAAMAILEGIPKILMGMKDELDRVAQWPDEKLFTGQVVLQMQGIDTIVRLSGDCKDLDHAVVLFGWAWQKFRDFDPEFLLNLFALTNDGESIAMLLRLWFLDLRIHDEIGERLRNRKISVKVLDWLKGGYNDRTKIDALLNQTRKQINLSVKAGRIPVSPEIRAILMRFKPKWRKTFPLESFSSEHPIKIDQGHLNAEDWLNNGITKYIEWFHQKMENLDKQWASENVEEGMEILKGYYSPLRNKRPPE